MTVVYIAIEQTLWKKDALRFDGQAITEDIVRDSSSDEVAELISTEVQLLLRIPA